MTAIAAVFYMYLWAKNPPAKGHESRDPGKTKWRIKPLLWVLVVLILAWFVLATLPAISRLAAGRVVFNTRSSTLPASAPNPAAAAPAESAWRQVLPNGVSVELLGVSENPSQGKPWWRPDGSPLKEMPYSSINATVNPNQKEVGREVAVRLTGLPKEQPDAVWAFMPERTAAGGGAVNERGAYHEDLRAIAVLLPSSDRFFSVKYGVAAGPWQTVTQGGVRGSSSTSNELAAVNFGPAYEADGAVMITVSHNVTGKAVRLVAVDRSDQEITAGNCTGGSAGEVHQLTCSFSHMRLEDVKEFRLQTRPYEWAEFKNVLVNPVKQPERAATKPVSSAPATAAATGGDGGRRGLSRDLSGLQSEMEDLVRRHDDLSLQQARIAAAQSNLEQQQQKGLLEFNPSVLETVQRDAVLQRLESELGSMEAGQDALGQIKGTSNPQWQEYEARRKSYTSRVEKRRADLTAMAIDGLQSGYKQQYLAITNALTEVDSSLSEVSNDLASATAQETPGINAQQRLDMRREQEKRMLNLKLKDLVRQQTELCVQQAQAAMARNALDSQESKGLLAINPSVMEALERDPTSQRLQGELDLDRS